MKKKNRKLEDLVPDAGLRQELINELYKGKPLLGTGGIFTELIQGFVNAALEGEVSSYLKSNKENGEKNRRNGFSKKQIKSEGGRIEITTPRDRNGTFEPNLVKKHSRQLGSGLDSIIISLYARGHSIEDIRRHITEIYGLEIGAGSISMITEQVRSEILSWQQRGLESSYVVVYLDAVHYKVRQDYKYKNMAVYVVLGITVDGHRDVLGLYLSPSEGAGQWGFILEDIEKRGVKDILFACVDGLAGLQDVIEQVYPQTIVQRCVVHMIRNSTRFVGYKDREKMIADLRTIYKASDKAQAKLALEVFGDKWNQKYPEVSKKWEENWEAITPYLDYTKHLRRMLYTTNPIEALHRILRKVTKSKAAWSTKDGLLKQLFLTLRYNEKSWKTKVLHWNPIQRELVDKFGERYTKRLI